MSIIIRDVYYPSVRVAAEKLRVSESHIFNLRKAGKLDQAGIPQPRGAASHKDPGHGDEVTIRGVTYKSHRIAADTLGVHPSAISKAKIRGTLERVGAGYRGMSPEPVLPPIATDLQSPEPGTPADADPRHP